MEGFIKFGAEICMGNCRKDLFVVKSCEGKRFDVWDWEMDDFI